MTDAPAPAFASAGALPPQRPRLDGRRVGVIGLGLMGRPMARALMAAGADVVVHNRSPEPQAQAVAEGAAPASSAAEVAARADTLILMLTDTPAVDRVAAEVIAAVKTRGQTGSHTPNDPPPLVIDMGTTAVLATRRLAAEMQAAGGRWIDAPVSGGQAGAEAQSLTILVGAETEADLARARPLFQVLGQRITHMGGVGAGQVAKAANQVIVGLTIGAVAEAFALARAAGVAPDRLREALKGGFADSRILDLHGQRMATGDFTPGGRATVQRKDMEQALALAEALGLTLPATALNRDLYDRLIAAGGGDLDHAALITILEHPTAP